MARRVKHPKLPNGYGSIKYLGSKRRNPYAVHPPTTEFNIDGIPQTPKALCYVNDWYKGFAVLTAYKAGTYYPGYEKTLPETFNPSDSKFIERVLADYNLTKAADERNMIVHKTFAEVYQEFYTWKYESDKSKQYSKSSQNSTAAAFKNCAKIHDTPFADLRHATLQKVVDDCRLKRSSKEIIVSLFKQMYKYAEIYELVDKNYAAHVSPNAPEDDEHGVPFSDNELRILWNHSQDPIVEMLLIMCYSGFRIGEIEGLSVDLENGYFRGGIKTAAGKNRIVPIHSGIKDLVVCRLSNYGVLLPDGPSNFRNDMYACLDALGIEKHTPHDCRHTFSSLCERYGVAENDRKRMLGHSFGQDITNSVYGHRTVEDLRGEIEKIIICY